jgi:signal-transduction protein with cAMP-binding, CBS, and nucleotidyltransferase domain
LTVIEAKRYGVFTCRETCTLSEASRHMVDEDVSALVVIDDQKCMSGIISRIDILRAWVSSPDWKTKLVSDYMNSHVVTVTPEATITDVARLLLEKQIHRVVVVREEEGSQRPVSVVSAADLIYHLVNAEV